MSQDWADKIAQQLFNRGLIQTGICLILGAADTGKTALTAALAKHAASSQPVGIIDADIGQSHIGPPATVGWAIVDNPQFDLSDLAVGGVSFVGDVTPTGHLLQLTAAIVQCVQQASKLSELIIIDTPGFVYGPAAAALWWTVQQLLKPRLILAVQRAPILQKERKMGTQRNDELSNILAGLWPGQLQLELIQSPLQMSVKSPKDRQSYRQSQFSKYFRDSCLYDISLTNIAVQTCPVRNSISGEHPTKGKISNGASRNLSCESLIHRIVALRDDRGVDIAIGLITDWQDDRHIAVVRAPKIDIRKIRCLVVGDVSIDITGG